MTRKNRLLPAAGAAALLSALAVLYAGGPAPDTRAERVECAKVGGVVASVDRVSLCTVDGSPVGSSSSDSYRNEAGYIPGLGLDDRWVRALSVPGGEAMGLYGSTEFSWISLRSGEYGLLVEGEEIERATCRADTPIRTTFAAWQAPPDRWVSARIEVTSGSERQGLAFRMYNDHSPPTLRSVRPGTIVGEVNRYGLASSAETVDVVLEDGRRVSLPIETDDTFRYTPEPGSGPITFETPSVFGRMTRRTLEFVDPSAPPPAVSMVGNTILWSGYSAFIQLDLDVTSQDPKGRLAGSANLLFGDGRSAVPLPLQVLKSSKLRTRPDKHGDHKLKVKLKSPKGYKPKVTAALTGKVHVDDGFSGALRMYAGKLKTRVTGDYKGTSRDIIAYVGRDNSKTFNLSGLPIVAVFADAWDGREISAALNDLPVGGRIVHEGPSPLEAQFQSEYHWTVFRSIVNVEDDSVPPNRDQLSLRLVLR